MSSNILCDPSKVAEVVGREFIEAQLPSNDSYAVNGILDNIRRINEGVGGADQAMQKVATLHGEYKGGAGELTALVSNMFGDNPSFTQSINELGNIATNITDVVGSVNEIMRLGEQLTFQDVSTALTKAYLRNVDILLPKSVSDGIRDNLNQFPLFTQISSSLGSLYYNLSLTDNALDLVDGVIQNVMDNTGLSTLLSQDSLIKMIPEYAVNLHNNIRHLQWLGMRVLPPCTYGKIFHKMDEALTHMYDLASDALFFTSILDNRKLYLKALLGIYGDLLKMVENYFPICHQYSIPLEPKTIAVGSNKTTNVNHLGATVGNNSINPPLIKRNQNASANNNSTKTSDIANIKKQIDRLNAVDVSGMTLEEEVAHTRKVVALLEKYKDQKLASKGG